MRINRIELIRFFDETREASPHASAIKNLAGEELGISLLTKYLNEARHHPPTNHGVPVEGGKKGCRLDAWLESEDNEGPILYQVEVKAWSFHSTGRVGGEPARLPIEAPPEVVSQRKIEMWGRYFPNENGFEEKGLKKVFARMINNPLPNVRVEPLACLWANVHPQGENSPFFTVDLNGQIFNDFHRLNVFSMSAYLRNLTDNVVELHIPNVATRLSYLRSIFIN